MVRKEQKAKSRRAIKKGRSVERLEFTFQENGSQTEESTTQLPEKKALANKCEKRIAGVPISEIEKNARPGETYETAAMRIAKQRGKGG